MPKFIAGRTADDTLVQGAVYGETDAVGPWEVGIDASHHEIHEGEAWGIHHMFSLASSGVGYLQVNVGAERRPHLRLIGASADSEKWLLEFIEAPTITDGSAAVTVHNRNRNYTTDPLVTCFSNPTNVSGGTTFDSHYLGGGTAQGQAKSGSASATDEEWPLKASTKYVIKATNGGAGAGKCNIRLFFYEEAVVHA